MGKLIPVSGFLSIQTPILCAAWLFPFSLHQLSIHLGTDFLGNLFQLSIITGSHVVSH